MQTILQLCLRKEDTVTPPATDGYVAEDGTTNYTTEDGSSNYVPEA